MACKTEVIVVAAGLGRRLGESTPKAFLQLGNQPLFCHAMGVFQTLPEISSCILVVPADGEARARSVCQQMPVWAKTKDIVCGGARRQDSVRCGMDALDDDTEMVLIHDAARPFCSADLIRRVVLAAEKHGAAVPGLPVADTLKRLNNEGFVDTTLDRRHLVSVQTPQGFRLGLLKQAYQNAWTRNLTATDDAGLVEHLGQPVAVVEGEAGNFKITRPYDLKLAEMLLART